MNKHENFASATLDQYERKISRAAADICNVAGQLYSIIRRELLGLHVTKQELQLIKQIWYDLKTVFRDKLKERIRAWAMMLAPVDAGLATFLLAVMRSTCDAGQLPVTKTLPTL
eukprot:3938702-Rhodomonas_salina.1